MATRILEAMLLTAALAVGWLAVQRAWRRAFPDDAPGGDALAGRLGCHGCTCATPCENNPKARPAAPDTN